MAGEATHILSYVGSVDQLRKGRCPAARTTPSYPTVDHTYSLLSGLWTFSYPVL